MWVNWGEGIGSTGVFNIGFPKSSEKNEFYRRQFIVNRNLRDFNCLLPASLPCIPCIWLDKAWLIVKNLNSRLVIQKLDSAIHQTESLSDG